MPTLTAGGRLGPYEILEPIGAGGMGEVYRGRDTRLDRIVAIKVLAPGLAKDVTSRERFEREAKTISSLNHPNICVLHDIGRDQPTAAAPPVDFLVMEFLEGETLSARLARGRLTVGKALAIAIPIAAALDCAHRQGVVHRDLKPGNVMLLSGGGVKLLDFGLARLSHAGGDKNDSVGHGMVSLADLSMPTVSSPLTVKGAILGTLQYMAPEQLEGKEVDARADIFAFGGVLYEMLTGKRPFEGKSQASLIGAILDHQPPPVTSLQPLCPAIVDEIVLRCLEKNPDDRWQTVRDLKRQLEWIASNAAASAAVASGRGPQLSGRRLALIATATLLTAGIAAGGVAWTLWPDASRTPAVARFALDLPEDQQLTRTGRHALALSPDGSRLVYVANQQLYLRSMNELTAKVIDGTESVDPTEPAFSPDGEWIAFWTTGELKKVPVGGGRPITLAKTGNPFGMSWAGDRILLGLATPRGVVEVPTQGGEPKLIVAVDEKSGEYAHYPTIIGGGRAVMFTLRTRDGRWDDALVVVQDLSTGARTTVLEGGTDARITPTGHLVYVREGTVFAAPFDESRMVVTGNAAPVVEGVHQGTVAVTSSGAAQFAIARTGALAFVPGRQGGGDRALIWVDRRGKVERASAHLRPYGAVATALRVSPDGSKVALIIDGRVSTSAEGSAYRGTDIWIWDITRDVLSPLTFTGRATAPLWTPDGKRVCYRQDDELTCQSADGSGQPQVLAKVASATSLRSFSPEGRHILLATADRQANNDIVVMELGSPPVARPLLQTRFDENSPAISPDGRWLAYQSSQSGRPEVYVRPFPHVLEGQWLVSTDGGVEPRWSRDGRVLFFTSSRAGGTAARNLLMSRVDPGSSFVSTKPTLLARLPGSVSAAYDAAPDGRVLFHEQPESLSGAAKQPEHPSIVLVQNWFEELRARVATSNRN